MFGCSEGLSPQENKTAICVASNQWSPSIEEIRCGMVDAKRQGKCVLLRTDEQVSLWLLLFIILGTSLPSVIATAVGVTLVGSAVVFTILGFLAGVLVMCLSTRKKEVHSTAEGQMQASVQPTVPAGPVYEDVSPPYKKEIELKSNTAYGSVGGH